MHIRVVAIEDHPLMLKAIVDTLNNHPSIEVVGTANHGSELMHLVREHKPDVVVLDLGMSTGYFEPITAISSVLEAFPNVRILVLTGYDDDVLVRAIIKAGALGYVLKSDDLSLSLPTGVERVYSGRHFYSHDVVDKLFDPREDKGVVLSEFELGVMQMAAQGLSNDSIATAMQISEKRVRTLLSSIYSKLDIHESGEINVRVAAIKKARDLGLIS